MHLAAWRMGPGLDLFFVLLLLLLFVCLFVCLLDFLVFLIVTFSFLMAYVRCHAINFFFFCGRGGGWWCGEERNGVNIELRMKEIWLEKRMPINQLIRQ